VLMRGGVVCIFYPYLFTDYLKMLQIVQIIHHRMAGWLVNINWQNMFKNAAITPWNRAQKLVVAQVYKKFSALNMFL
jgi:hypothetical protein